MALSPHSSASSSRQSIRVTPMSYRSLAALSTQSRDWVSTREKELYTELCEERRSRKALEGELRKCRKENHRVREELHRLQSQPKAVYTNKSSEGDYLIHSLEHVASMLENTPDLRVLYHGRVGDTRELLAAVSSGRLQFALQKVVQVLSDFVSMYTDRVPRAVDSACGSAQDSDYWAWKKHADCQRAIATPALDALSNSEVRAEAHTALLETMAQQRCLLSVLSRQLQRSSQRLLTAAQENSPRRLGGN